MGSVWKSSPGATDRSFLEWCLGWCASLLQALELKPNYALALYVKGTLEFAEENWDGAARCFTHANNNRKDIYSYKGALLTDAKI